MLIVKLGKNCQKTNFKKLLEQSGKHNEKRVKKQHLWLGRTVKSIDGSTVSMPDTINNQQAYPHHSSQKEGCGPGGGDFKLSL